MVIFVLILQKLLEKKKECFLNSTNSHTWSVLGHFSQGKRGHRNLCFAHSPWPGNFLFLRRSVVCLQPPDGPGAHGTIYKVKHLIQKRIKNSMVPSTKWNISYKKGSRTPWYHLQSKTSHTKIQRKKSRTEKDQELHGTIYKVKHLIQKRIKNWLPVSSPH